MRLLRNILLLSVSLTSHYALAENIVVYEQEPELVSAFISDFNNSFLQETADNFVLDNDYIINDVHWYGFYPYELTDEDNFTVRFYEPDGSGIRPGNILYEFSDIDVQRVASGLGTSGNVYEYNLDPLPYYPKVELTAGETYWLSVINQTPDGQWNWLSNGEGTFYARFDTNGDGSIEDEGWVIGDFVNFAFSLTVSVPNSTNLSLFIMLALILLYTLRTKTQKGA